MIQYVKDVGKISLVLDIIHFSQFIFKFQADKRNLMKTDCIFEYIIMISVA